MDPNENLREILEHFSRYKNDCDRDRVQDLLVSLAAWIHKGGFVPEVREIKGRTYEIGPAEEPLSIRYGSAEIGRG